MYLAPPACMIVKLQLIIFPTEIFTNSSKAQNSKPISRAENLFQNLSIHIACLVRLSGLSLIRVENSGDVKSILVSIKRRSPLVFVDG